MSALAEKMRKLREARERAAAAAASAPAPLQQQQQSSASSTSTAAEAAGAGPKGETDVNKTAPASARSPHPPPTLPQKQKDQHQPVWPIAAPPSFLSPASAILQYRDPSRDPLSAPFTANAATRVLQELLLGLSKVSALAGAGVKRSRQEPAEEENKWQMIKTKEEEAAVSPVAFTVDYMRQLIPFLSPYEEKELAQKSSDSHSSSSSSALSLHTNAWYKAARARATIDVSGRPRPPCRDVNRYLRKDRIAQGVYGVVFSATDAKTGELFAVKHIKKQWLEESEIGFPPYLLREFDLLLRIHHPNIVESRELVVLDPEPLPIAPAKANTEEIHIDGASDAAAAADKTSTPPRAPSRPQPAPQRLMPTQKSAKDVFLVMQHCPFDLKNYMLRYSGSAPFQPYLHVTSRSQGCRAVEENFLARVKCIAWQLFEGLRFLHAHRILHRDVKTSNVLLDKHGVVKLCDFGLGRYYREGQALTPTVVTLMYRAPELHLGITDYSHAMDVWSMGCVVAELFLKAPLFRAAEEVQHLTAVCDVLGIPNEETFTGVYRLSRAKEVLKSMGRWNRVNKLAQAFYGEPSGHENGGGGSGHGGGVAGKRTACYDARLLPPSGLDLFQRLFAWNPAQRPSAAEVLSHPFFHEAPLPCDVAELTRPMPCPPPGAGDSTEVSAASITPVSAGVRKEGENNEEEGGIVASGQPRLHCQGRDTRGSAPPPLVHIKDPATSTVEGHNIHTSKQQQRAEEEEEEEEEASLTYSNAMSPVAAVAASPTVNTSTDVVEGDVEEVERTRARQRANADVDE